MSKAPRFTFVPSLGVCLADPHARTLFAEALGLPAVDADSSDEELVYELGERGALFVDTREQRNAPLGFLPMFATDDIEAARAHLLTFGLSADPLPWAPEAPAFVVRAPGGASFCVAERRARTPAGGLLTDDE